jgi:hypothetical protein
LSEGKQALLFEKKKQKTFLTWASGCFGIASYSKSFLVLFSKKNRLLTSSGCSARPNVRGRAKRRRWRGRGGGLPEGCGCLAA